MRLLIRIPVLLLVLCAESTWANGPIAAILEAARNTNVKFSRLKTNAPFYPAAWLEYRQYSDISLSDERDRELGNYRLHRTTQGLLLPAYAAEKDLLLIGEYAAWSDFDSKSDSQAYSPSVWTVSPLMAWIHQVNDDNQVGAFVAPFFGADVAEDDFSISVWAGIMGLHFYRDDLSLIYGGAYGYTFGEPYLYPYLGINWILSEEWTATIIMPWPTLIYAPSKDYFFRFGFAASGAEWIREDGGTGVAVSMSGWDFVLGFGCRLHGPLWLQAGAGYTGFAGVRIDDSGDIDGVDIDPSPVFSISIQYRPETD